MAGGTRKRGKTWSYYFDLAQVDGKRQKKEKGGFRTKKDAEIALAAALNEFNNTGAVFTPTESSVSDYFNFWFDNYCKINLKYNSQTNYLQIIENYLKPQFGMYKLKNINTTSIQEFINDLKVNKKLAKTTLKNIFTVLKGSLDYAVEPMHFIKLNPCTYVKFPKYTNAKQEVRYVIAPDQFKKILDRFPPSNHFYIPLMLGYYAGLRISETFALTWDDIDFENRILHINKQVLKRNFGVDVRKAYEKKGKKAIRSLWYFGTPKSVTSSRDIRFGDTLYRVLKDAKLQKNKNRLKYGEYYVEHYIQEEPDEKGDTIQRILPVPRAVPCSLPKADMVCIREDGELLTPDSFKYCSKIIHYELKMAFNYHSLRHTHATYLVEKGANLKDVQERLGHANIQITLNNYVHNSPEQQKRSVEIFEAAAKIS